MRKLYNVITYLILMKFFLLHCMAFSLEISQDKEHFPEEILNNPREHADEIAGKFQYSEQDIFVIPTDTLSIVLKNSYASAKLTNTESITELKKNYTVTGIKLVYTKYPFNNKDWLTNYYDLLAWRLQELFALDSTLNNTYIEWELIAQTSCKTASQAKDFFHGIVILLAPLEIIAEDIPDENNIPTVKETEGIPNGGFLFKEERNPDYYRSRLEFTPEPGRELRRNMDPKKLKCPTWR